MELSAKEGDGGKEYRQITVWPMHALSLQEKELEQAVHLAWALKPQHGLWLAVRPAAHPDRPILQCMPSDAINACPVIDAVLIPAL